MSGSRAVRRAVAKSKAIDLAKAFGVPFQTAWKAIVAGVADRCVALAATASNKPAAFTAAVNVLTAKGRRR